MPSQYGSPGVRADRSAAFGVFDSLATMCDERELGTHFGGAAAIGPTAPQGNTCLCMSHASAIPGIGLVASPLR